MRTPVLVVLFGCLLSACALNPDVQESAVANEVAIEQTTRMAAVVGRALQKAEHYGPDRVLVVFDIDSTLLRNPGDLGGNGWGGWQKALLASEAVEPEQVARNREHFLQIERALMYLTPLLPTEEELVAQVNRLRETGIATYALTARGTDMRDMTLRELESNGLGFSGEPECGAPLCVSRGVIAADQVYAAARRVLGERELKRLGFDKGRRVSVANGVMMASGLDKGVMLRVLLASLERRFDAVVFVDDATKNVVNVQRASRNMPQDLSLFEYTGPYEDHQVSRDRKRQAGAAAAWEDIRSTVCRHLQPRWCDARNFR